MTWTPERVGLLKRLWAEGLSATLIAMELRGVSRSAVLGKIYRLGLCGRGQPAAQKRKVAVKPPRHRVGGQHRAEANNRAILADVRRLAAEGYSSGQIAEWARENTGQECSPNRIANLCSRNDIMLPRSRASTGPRLPRRRPTRTVRRAWPPLVLVPAPPAKMLSLDELTRTTCRWPIGDPAEGEGFGFCGYACSAERPYCEHHMAVGYQAGTASRPPGRLVQRTWGWAA